MKTDSPLPQTNVRFSALARKVLEKISQEDGCSMRDVLERLLRQEGRKRGIEK